MPPSSRMAPPPLAGVVVVAAALLLLLPEAAEPRTLLSLDDFGAVGDGVANDTQVSSS
jgi:galacturan 1,4-alpha-galacturonidase